MVHIPREEYEKRVATLRARMKARELDAVFVYGDEYRRENLRYLSNVWPIFERAAIMIPLMGDPVMLCAPEGEMLIREMTPWTDVRLVPEFTCVTVPDEIEYPFASYTSFKKVFQGMGPLSNVGIVGLDAMPGALQDILKSALDPARVEDANDILIDLRKRKTPSETACLTKAGEIADLAYEAMMRAAKPGVTELYLAGIATGEAMKAGAEFVPFCLVSSGERVKTIIGRATNKVIEDGDMVMAALAVQYEGYIASFNFPFVVGSATDGQSQLISWLVEAFEAAMSTLKAGNEQAALVRAVKGCFAKNAISDYDLYPPLHGCGLSEAESPYPNEHTAGAFEAQMTVNTDISIFGHPFGSNRIEASFIVTEDGYHSTSRLILRLIESWKKTGSYLGALSN